MDRLLKIILQNYDPREKEVCLTAKFVSIITLCTILTMVTTMGFTVYFYGVKAGSLFPQMLGFSVMLVSLGLLAKGKHTIAAHFVFITGFATIWAVMFLPSGRSIIITMDSIVYIIGLLAAIPLALSDSRRPIIPAYYFSNVFIFLLYNHHLNSTATLSFNEHFDYFLDNLLIMTLVFLASVNMLKIRQNTFSSLKAELANRKKAENDLLESRNQLSIHLENTPVGAISWDTEFRVREWNPAAETIFGYSREEAMGKHAADLILPEDVREQVDLVFQNLLTGRGGERSMNENITKSGKRVLCDWYNTRLKTLDGKITGVASLVNDITERKKTQEMMIQSEKMMSVGGLAAGMAHEINNPLSGIMQNAQIIHHRLTRDIPANHDTDE